LFKYCYGGGKEEEQFAETGRRGIVCKIVFWKLKGNEERWGVVCKIVFWKLEGNEERWGVVCKIVFWKLEGNEERRGVVCKIVFWKLKGNEELGRPGPRWESNIMCIKLILMNV